MYTGKTYTVYGIAYFNDVIYLSLIHIFKYESENAIVEVHFADITDSERQIRHKQLEQGLIKYYKNVVDCIGKWPDEDCTQESNSQL